MQETKKNEAEEKTKKVEAVTAATANEEARGEEAAAEELAAAKTAKVKASAEKDVDKGPPTNRWVSFFDRFYPCLPLTSNSTFIVFIPGLPQ